MPPLTKLNPAGSALVYSTYLGGSDFDSASGLVVDGAGSAYVTGGAVAELPDTPGAYDTTPDGGDGFVIKLNPAGSALVFSTFIGGSDFDSTSDVVLDPAGNAWLTGGTTSADFPVTAGCARHHLQRRRRRDHRRAEPDRFGAPLLDAPRRLAIGGRRRHRAATRPATSTSPARPSRRTSRRRSARSTGLEWRPLDLLGRRVRHEDRHPRQYLDAGRRRPACRSHRRSRRRPTPSSQPQPITFDWNDVAEAVSYTIQIDDSSAFRAPLIREQSVTQSVLPRPGLRPATHFWRVRGVNSAGAVGPGRPFELHAQAPLHHRPCSPRGRRIPPPSSAGTARAAPS